MEYTTKAPPIPRLEMKIGTTLTATNREILSTTPNSPQLKLLMSLGNISPEIVFENFNSKRPKHSLTLALQDEDNRSVSNSKASIHQ